MTEVPITRTTRRPLLRGVVGAVALLLVVSACTGSSSVEPSTPETSGAAVETNAASTTSSTSLVLTDRDMAVGDPAQALRDAIAMVGTRYEFDTSVQLTGGTLTLVSGRVYDDSSAYLITTVGSEVEYVITPDGRWVREPGSDWVPLQEAAPVDNPLASLSDPQSVDIVSVEGPVLTLTARYNGTDVGFDSDDPVDIEFVINLDRLATLRYQAPAGDDVATVETRFAVTTDVAPVIAPVQTG